MYETFEQRVKRRLLARIIINPDSTVRQMQLAQFYDEWREEVIVSVADALIDGSLPVSVAELIALLEETLPTIEVKWLRQGMDRKNETMRLDVEIVYDLVRDRVGEDVLPPYPGK
jgi:hypothetical protein